MFQLEFFRTLLELERSRQTPENIKHIISFLQGDVLRGTVEIDTTAGYPEILYEEEGNRFRLHQASSMVSEVAPFVLFLKYLIRKGDLLIIEEPESHLDPTNQRNVARTIAMLVNAGVRVLVTTHSDYFVNQVSNLLLLSEVSRQRRTSRGYKANEVLDPADVGAYRFRRGSDGTQVDALEITASTGIPMEPWTDVHGDLYDEAIVLERP